MVVVAVSSCRFVRRSVTSLADELAPEDVMARAAARLIDVAPDGIDRWFEAVLRSAGVDPLVVESAETGHRIGVVRDRVVAELAILLDLDPDVQRESPLQILRQVTPVANELLREAGVALPRRDDEAIRLHPDDHYDVVPVAFADFGPDVGDAGLEWGAAKAFLHLRRRRPPDPMGRPAGQRESY